MISWRIINKRFELAKKKYMNNIKQLILSIAPAAVFAEGLEQFMKNSMAKFGMKEESEEENV
jgi:hypothetical protein